MAAAFGQLAKSRDKNIRLLLFGFFAKQAVFCGVFFVFCCQRVNVEQPGFSTGKDLARQN